VLAPPPPFAFQTPTLAAVLPPPATPLTPVPPGGATAPSTAPRREKAHKHASQSAYTIRPAGSSADWFYPATAAATLAFLALAGVAFSRPSARPAPAAARGRRRNA
jgi:hypothetical protein